MLKSFETLWKPKKKYDKMNNFCKVQAVIQSSKLSSSGPTFKHYPPAYTRHASAPYMTRLSTFKMSG